MRAREFLIEYNRQRTLDVLGGQLAQVDHDQKKLSPEETLARLEAMDPTPNKQYMLWLAKQYIKQQFRIEDAVRVKELLANYNKLKPRLPTEQRDTNRLDFYQMDDLVDAVLDPEIGSDAAAGDTFPVIPNSEVLYNGPLGQLAVPKNKEASCELGAGTKWCTAARGNNYFSEYSQDGPLYVWRDRDGSKYQFHWPSVQFMDSRDQPIDSEKLNYFRTQHPVLKKLFAREEAAIAKDPRRAYYYARDLIGGRWPKAEPLIAQNPQLAYRYARYVIDSRWPEGEPVIAQDPELAYHYACYVIGGRWPEAEPVIAQDPELAYLYARYVIGGRWPEAEPVIAPSPKWAYLYARYVIGGRWPGAEAAIVKEADPAYLYARYVIDSRWPEAEPVIAEDPNLAYYYARYVIGGRWPKAEPAIARDPEWAQYYARYVIGGRWPKAEPAIAQDPKWAYYYAHYVIKGRWPKAEPAIARDTGWEREYKNFLNRLENK